MYIFDKMAVYEYTSLLQWRFKITQEYFQHSIYNMFKYLVDKVKKC